MIPIIIFINPFSKYLLTNSGLSGTRDIKPLNLDQKRLEKHLDCFKEVSE